ncbi:MAG: AMP-binding protein [Pseudomonadota bacterium]
MRTIERAEDWETMRAAFRWRIPERLNLAEALVGAHARATPDRTALEFLRPDGEVRIWTYGDLERASARFASALLARGLRRGDRMGLLLPQTPEALIAHLAAWRIGAVTVPLFTLFGADALSYRLQDSGARMVVTDAANLPKLLTIRDDLGELSTIWSTDRPTDGAWGFWQELAKASGDAPRAETGAEDPALISYTSGTTGPPKGALHAHRILYGHLPGFETHHEFAPRKGDRMWTPADWAWLGGLANAMMPALALGVPLVAHRMAKFDPEHAWDLMRRLEVRNVFFPPTALKLLRQRPLPKSPPRLRTIGAAGEALGESLLDWGLSAFGVTINEFYGQTECNMVLGNCAEVFPPVPGSTGRAIPGHDVAILDAAGAPLPAGELGEIAVAAPDPSMFLRYWNQPEKTAEKFVDGPDGRRWLRTGDEGRRDAAGNFFFSSRADDVITSSGYRIGPTEIEDCLAGHPAVAMAAVVGLPDEVRTEAVTAFVVLTPGADEAGLAEALTARVRDRVSAHAAPRAVHVVEGLPMTATGKIMRREVKRAALDAASPAA